ncbi:type IV pilin-like G/H family protein [Coleofasciculus sp. E1-EBD-02]|uniref:type IV pilin-like G/H family protein n=1 Tax=Coleofasciculus sp. E1-EBD-02 TaxID=3068481 RepID=UPI003303D4E8
MLVDKNSGYSCGWLALLGIIGIGFMFLLVKPLIMVNPSKAKQYEAKQYTGSMNRAQQAYFLEKSNFTNNIGELGLGISTETTNYTYSTSATILSSINYGVSRQSDLKSYMGGVFLGDAEATGELTTFAILCETKDKGTNRPPAPIVEDGRLQCAPGTESLSGGDQEVFFGEDGKLVYISANYAKAGKYNQALDTVETITEEGFKAKALQIIATELVAAGESEQALRVTRNISDDSIKSNTIQAIALKLTDAGESEQALRVTRHITDDSIKSKTIQAIVPYLTTATEHEQAIQVAKTMTDYQPKTKALDAIVRRLVATGNPKRAVQIAQTIQSYYGGKEKAMAAIEGYKR